MLKDKKFEKGAVTLEFSLTILVFFLVVVSLMEFSRLMLMWNAMTDAVQLAARDATVCNSENNQVSALVQVSGQAGPGDWGPVSKIYDTLNQVVEVRVPVAGVHLLLPDFGLINNLGGDRFRTAMLREYVDPAHTGSACF